MPSEEVKLTSDENLIKGLKREAMMTVAPERMTLYGDAAYRIKQLTGQLAKAEEPWPELYKCTEGCGRSWLPTSSDSTEHCPFCELARAEGEIKRRDSFEGCDGCSTGDCPHDNYPTDCIKAQAEIIAEQEARIVKAEAEAVVEKLPVTANGVRVVPGDIVFHPDWDSYLPSIEVWSTENHRSIYYGLRGMTEWLDGFEEDYPSFLAFSQYYEEDTGAGDHIVVSVSDCYSTREEAEAALATRSEGDG